MKFFSYTTAKKIVSRNTALFRCRSAIDSIRTCVVRAQLVPSPSPFFFFLFAPSRYLGGRWWSRRGTRDRVQIEERQGRDEVRCQARSVPQDKDKKDKKKIKASYSNQDLQNDSIKIIMRLDLQLCSMIYAAIIDAGLRRGAASLLSS